MIRRPIGILKRRRTRAMLQVFAALGSIGSIGLLLNPVNPGIAMARLRGASRASGGGKATAVSSAKPTVAAVRANPFRVGRTLVIPHGGGDGLFPENTMYAYEKSQVLGGDVIDLDVFMAAGNVLIAMHDDTLERTTNGTGRVSQTAYPAIAKLDAGWNFKKNGKFPFRNQGLRVPTIESVLKHFPHTPATLDLKDLRVEVVGPICSLLRKLKRTSDVYVGVDTVEQVMAFRSKCPEVSTSGTDAERRAMRAARDTNDLTFTTKQLVGQPRYVGDDGTKRITTEYLAFSHAKGIAVLTWVVDDPKDMAELIKLGVDGIYTRRPDLLVRVLKDLKRLK